MSDRDLEFQDWGLIEYSRALAKMRQTLEDVIEHRHGPGVLVFCTHPPVVTLGRATRAGDVFGWQGPVLEISRGGRATYHGPSQLVVYPVLNLKEARRGRGPQEIAGYLRTLENGIIEVLGSYGLKGVGKSLRRKEAGGEGADETGVWVGSRKVASLGIGVRHWVTSHGAAINVDRDPEAFQGMNPCGFRSDVMASMEELHGAPVDRAELTARLKAVLLRLL